MTFRTKGDVRPPKACELAAQRLILNPQCREAADDDACHNHRAFNGKILRTRSSLVKTVDLAKERVMKRIDGIRDFAAEECKAPQTPR
jgi:hypothetical protein